MGIGEYLTDFFPQTAAPTKKEKRHKAYMDWIAEGYKETHHDKAIIKSFAAIGRKAPGQQFMSRGNMKLAKTILIFNLPPIKSCPVHKACAKTCYAVPAYKLYPSARDRWDDNFAMARNEISYLEHHLSSQIEREKKKKVGVKAVRFHSSGDFFNQAYVDMWHRIVKAHPDVKFYTYTKTEKLFNFKGIEAEPNFNLIRSFLPGGELNYGPEDYIHDLKKKYPKAYICPAIKDKSVHCGAECNYCIKGNMPLFYQH